MAKHLTGGWTGDALMRLRDHHAAVRRAAKGRALDVAVPDIPPPWRPPRREHRKARRDAGEEARTVVLEASEPHAAPHAEAALEPRPHAWPKLGLISHIQTAHSPRIAGPAEA